MSRHVRNFGITSALVGVLLIALFAIVAIVVSAGLAQVEDEETRQDVRRVLNLLSAQVADLVTLTGDYAGWDDTYAFIEDRNEPYIQSNLVAGTFTKLRLNAMLFVHSSGRIVYAQGYDWQAEQPIPVPASLQNQIFPGSRLLLHADTESQFGGILLLPEGALLIASRPILTSEYRGPIRGTLIFARYLDAAEMRRLGELTALSLSTRRWDESALPSDFQSARAALTQDATTFALPLDDETMAGYARLDDIYAKPALILRVVKPRPIHAQARVILLYLLGAFALTGLAFGALAFRSYERLERSHTDIAALRQAQAALQRRDAILQAVSFAAEQFLKMPTWEPNIQSVLARLGQAAAVSRVYLFENHPAANGAILSSQRYEWVAPGITPQIDSPELQNFDWVEMGFARWVETMSRGGVVHDHVRNLPVGERAVLDAQNIKSILGVPIFVEHRWWGFIGFDECLSEREWTSAEIDALKAAADTLGAAIERRRVDQELHALIRYFFLLNEITQVGIATADWQEMLQTFVTRVAELLQADGCLITLWDEATQTLQQGAAYGLLRDADAPLSNTLGILAGAVLAAGHAVPIEDTRQSSYLDPRTAAEYPFRSLLGLPLIVGERKLGALMIAFGPSHHFTLEEIARGGQAAGQIALALAQKRLLEQTQQRAAELEALRQAALGLTSSLDLPAVLDSILANAMRLAQSPRDAHIYLYQNDRLSFGASLWADGRQGEQWAEPRSNGLTYAVARSGQAIVVPDMQGHPLYATAPSHWSGAIVGLPLKMGGRVVGVMNIAYAHPRDIPDAELRALGLLADQAAIAIANARLFEETQRRALEQTIVGEIARALNATLDVRQAFPSLVQGIRRLLPTCERASLALLDDSGEHFVMFLLDQPRPELAEGVRLPLDASAAAADLIAWRVHLTPDLAAEIDFPAERALYDAGFRSRVNIPLWLGERGLGALNLASRKVAAFDVECLPVLEQIASTLAIALENQRLFNVEQSRRGELSALYALSRDLAGALELDTVLQHIVRHSVETIRVTFAAIAVLEEDMFVIRAAYPMRPLDRDLEMGCAARAEGLLWEIAQGAAPVVLERQDARLDAAERAWLGLDLVRALLLVPLRAGERVQGLLMLGEEREQARESFDAEKIRLARSIGDQATSAMHRAELHAELERAYLQAVLALANAVDAKDSATSDHSRRLADLALAIGRELGLSPRALEDLRYGAILHDIGKIGVPDAVLLKPAELNPEEWAQMHRHPSIGDRILAALPRLAGAAEIVRHHHERYDGSGYPAGLAGEAIPLGARILAIVDAYGAIIDERVYKPARSHADALAEIQRCAGTQFDPRLVEIFLRLVASREGQR